MKGYIVWMLLCAQCRQALTMVVVGRVSPDRVGWWISVAQPLSRRCEPKTRLRVFFGGGRFSKPSKNNIGVLPLNEYQVAGALSRDRGAEVPHQQHLGCRQAWAPRPGPGQVGFGVTSEDPGSLAVGVFFHCPDVVEDKFLFFLPGLLLQLLQLPAELSTHGYHCQEALFCGLFWMLMDTATSSCCCIQMEALFSFGKLGEEPNDRVSDWFHGMPQDSVPPACMTEVWDNGGIFLSTLKTLRLDFMRRNQSFRVEWSPATGGQRICTGVHPSDPLRDVQGAPICACHAQGGSCPEISIARAADVPWQPREPRSFTLRSKGFISFGLGILVLGTTPLKSGCGMRDAC